MLILGHTFRKTLFLRSKSTFFRNTSVNGSRIAVTMTQSRHRIESIVVLSVFFAVQIAGFRRFGF